MTLKTLAKRQTREQTRQRILAKADELFRHFGIAKTTVADIAAGLSMSPANIYKSFPSKDAIIQAVAEQELAELIKSIETAVSSSSGALARIEALALAIFHWHRELLRQESQLFQLGVGPLAFEAPAVFTGDEPTGSICCRRRPGRLDETGGERGRRRRHGGGVHPPIPEGGITR